MNLAAGTSLTYVVTADISASATGTLTNSANVKAPVGVTDPTPLNNMATDTDTLSPGVDLLVTKSDNDGGSSVGPTTGTVVPGSAGHLHDRRHQQRPEQCRGRGRDGHLQLER